MIEPRRQLYSESGQPAGSATKSRVLTEGLLHGCSHVWLWCNDSPRQLLLQVRAADKLTWPGRYDISAAGHIDRGETPEAAARRETQEELGIVVDPKDLKLLRQNRIKLEVPGTDWIENELQWIYAYELPSHAMIKFASKEVSSTKWMTFAQIEELLDQKPDMFVYGHSYFDPLFTAIKKLA